MERREKAGVGRNILKKAAIFGVDVQSLSVLEWAQQ